MRKVVITALTMLASLAVSAVVVAGSPKMQLGESKILNPVFVVQILGAVAGLVFVMVPIIFSRLEKVRPGGRDNQTAELLSELKTELRSDTYFLMLLFAVSLVIGILSEIDFPYLSDCFFVKKSALVSILLLWFLLLGARVFLALLSSMFQVLSFDVSQIENADQSGRAR